MNDRDVPEPHRPHAAPIPSSGRPPWAGTRPGHPHLPPEPRPGPTGPGKLSWPLVLGLGAVALVRPLANITGLAEAVGRPAAPLLLTALITLTWVLVVGLGRIPRPVATLTLAALVYAVAIVPLSAVLSPLLTGSLQGPAANPVALVPILVTNALWGVIAGLLAAGVQHMTRGDRGS